MKLPFSSVGKPVDSRKPVRNIPKRLSPKKIELVKSISQADSEFERKNLVHGIPEDCNLDALIGAAQFPDEKGYSVEYRVGADGWEKSLKQTRGVEEPFDTLIGKDIVISGLENNGIRATILYAKEDSYFVSAKEYTKYTSLVQIEAIKFMTSTGIRKEGKIVLLPLKEYEDLLLRFPELSGVIGIEVFVKKSDVLRLETNE